MGLDVVERCTFQRKPWRRQGRRDERQGETSMKRRMGALLALAVVGAACGHAQDDAPVAARTALAQTPASASAPAAAAPLTAKPVVHVYKSPT